MKLPERIKKYIDTAEYETDTVGMSNSSVLLFDNKVLKIQEQNEEAEQEAQVMQWLRGRIPVPELICHEKQDGKSYLLMSKLPGVMACDASCMEQPKELTAVLAAGLRMLWQIDIETCVYQSNLDKKLQMARYNVEHDLVDVEACEPDTFGKDGFESPKHLLDWLEKNRPQEEFVFSHGDYCLPNVFIKDGAVSGFLDLGKAGIADKYQDIALCYRSLKHNYEGKYGGETYEGFNPDYLFEELGIEPDWDKIRYYILLDELF